MFSNYKNIRTQIQVAQINTDLKKICVNPCWNIRVICVLTFLFLNSIQSKSQNSILQKGDFYKIGITKTGVYKIDAKFLQKVGLQITNPQNIKIYGNGGAMLPQANAAPRPKDLIENAIYVEGEDVGKMDFILFYGESPHTIRYNSAGFSHQINYYSDTTYYFLTVSDSKGLRIKNQPSVASTNNIETFDDFIFYEKELKNMVNSGREWFGEYFMNNTEQSFDVKLDGVVPNSELKITSSILAASPIPTQMNLKINNQAIGNHALDYIDLGRYSEKGILNNKNFTLKTDGNSTQKITYQFDGKSNTASGAYLNFFEIQIQQKIQNYAEQTVIRSIASNQLNSANFIIQNANSQLKIWDISNPFQITSQSYQLSGNQANFGVLTKNLYKTFILFNNNNTLEPESIRKISNQNLQNTETPDLLIVTSKNWQNEANRLAQFRQQNDGLKTLVVNTEEVYNEFASGKSDITAIRDFARFLWQKNPAKLKYLLLFADASFDFKNKLDSKEMSLQNLIPSYQSHESVHPVETFSSDDYFGFFQDDAGEWKEDFFGNHQLNIGIGRLPAKNATEARNIVDKLIIYASKNTIGRWRGKVSFVADDIDQYRYDHQLDAENISSQVFKNNNSLTINKVYLDIFPQISTPNGAKSPKANEALNKAVNDGSLIVNYNGHGDETGWTEEKVLTIGQIQSWKGVNNMPIFLTATCEFGRYDNPNSVSGAELIMLNRKGAGIALLTTTRPVYANTNNLLSQEFYKSAFTFQNGRLRRLGDIFRETKNNSTSGVFNRNFTLLGDPSMALAYPKELVKLTKINSQKPDNQPIKALSKVTLEGEVLSNQDQKTPLTNFNGTIFVSIFDKAKRLSTLGAKGVKMNYQAYPNQIFEGKAKVQNGKFSLTFVVPKDIDYEIGEGRIQFYAINSDSTVDAIGSDKILIGGSENNTANDNQPPKIQLFMEDETFKSGGTVSPNTTLIVKVSDENGINLSRAGIGHEMSITLNDTLTIAANEYFSNDEDYTKGTIRYPFVALPKGKHTIKSKIWDTYNNSAESALEFIVTEERFKINSVINYPNPVTDQTNFKIEHNRAGEDIEWQIGIYDVSGKLIHKFKENCYNCDSIVENITLQSADWAIDKPKGLYFYKILAKTQSEDASAGGKIVISSQ